MKSRCGSRAFVLFCAVGLLALPAVASTLGSDTFVIVKPPLKTGEVRRLVATLIIRAHDQKHEMVTKIVEKYNRTVKAVKPDGSAILVIQFEVMKILTDGKEMPSLGQPPIVTITRPSHGKMTAVAKGGTIEGGADIGIGLQEQLDEIENLYPKKAVAVGDRWPVTCSVGSSKGMGQAELMGTEQIAGAKALNIKFTVELNADDPHEKSHLEGVLTVNATTGEILKYVTTESGDSPEETLTSKIVLLALGKDPKDDPMYETK
jgi:hypothetical protein